MHSVFGAAGAAVVRLARSILRRFGAARFEPAVPSIPARAAQPVRKQVLMSIGSLASPIVTDTLCFLPQLSRHNCGDGQPYDRWVV